MKEETYWSIVIESGWVQAAIWAVDNSGVAKVFSTGAPSSWSSDEDLVTAVDTTLSAAIQAVTEGTPEPSKTVFGVNSSWVVGGEIKEEFLSKIKKICAKLSLTPSGFVVLPEAVAHYYKSQEGSPTSAVIIGISDAMLDVSVFRLGRLTGSVSVTRSVSLVEDVIEGLARFGKSEPLPSRFLIYNLKEGELEEARQTLTNTDWKGLGDKLSFLHTPKIETLNAEGKMLAVCLAGASEIGKATTVSYVSKKKGKEENENLPQNETQALEPQDVGFRVGQDVGQAAPTALNNEFMSHKSLGILAKVKGLVSAFIPKRLPFPASHNLAKKVPIIGGIAFLVLIILGFLAWWFLPKATVTVFVSPQKLEAAQAAVLSTKTTSLDLKAKRIPALLVKTKVTGEKEAATTGVKVVGDKAKGKVMIRNGTDEPVRFPAGTLIASSSNLKFSLDASASISAALSPTSPGTAEVEVTAGDIGSEYNLAKDEVFSVANYSKGDLDAVATAGFSGGSSNEIASVAEEDRKNLEDSLTEELVNKALEELGSQASSDSIFVENAAKEDVLSRDFSHKVADEATTLKLTMEVEVASFLLKKEDVEAFAREKLSSQIPAGFVLRGDQIVTEFNVEEETEDEWQVEISFTINLLPEIKPEEIARDIAGKYRSLAEERLARIPGFVRAKITVNPQLPGKLGSLPRVAKHIAVEVAAER